jgi:hypothetical protein
MAAPETLRLLKDAYGQDPLFRQCVRIEECLDLMDRQFEAIERLLRAPHVGETFLLGDRILKCRAEKKKTALRVVRSREP